MPLLVGLVNCSKKQKQLMARLRLAEKSAIEKVESLSAVEQDRRTTRQKAALSDYNVQPTVLQRLRLQNTLDRIAKVRT